MGCVASVVLLGCSSGSSGTPDQIDSDPIQDTPPSAALTNRAPTADNACLQPISVQNGLQGRLADYVADADGDVLQYSLNADTMHGSVDIDLTTGQFTYTPSTTERGYFDYFRYNATDTEGASAEGTVSIVVGERRIMPFGDSITAGVTHYTGSTGDQPMIPSRLGYRKLLNDSLQSAGFAIDFVGSEYAGQAAGLEDNEHQGHPGFTTTQLADNVFDWLTANPADVMLIHVGTNDLSTDAQPVELLLQQIQNWQILNHPVDVIVSTIVDHHADANWVDVVEDYNADLLSRLSTNWPEVTVVDQYTALDNVADMSPLSVDSVGLHPNLSGYSKMADTWLGGLISSAAVNRCAS